MILKLQKESKERNMISDKDTLFGVVEMEKRSRMAAKQSDFSLSKQILLFDPFNRSDSSLFPSFVVHASAIGDDANVLCVDHAQQRDDRSSLWIGFREGQG